MSQENENVFIGILLAGGKSTRFNALSSSLINNSKLFYPISQLDNKLVIECSIDALINNNITYLVIVTNSLLYSRVQSLICEKYDIHKEKILLVVNDIDDRLISLKVGIQSIHLTKQWGYGGRHVPHSHHIVIHDGARPFIRQEHIDKLIQTFTVDKCLFSQYCLKIYNGLYDIKNGKALNPINHIELCTPLCINYSILQQYADSVLQQYFNNSNSDNEFLTFIKNSSINIKYQLIYGKYNDLKKITVIDDVI